MRGTADDPKGSPGIAACRVQTDGSTAPATDAVFGSEPRVTRRRAMTVFDAMFQSALFWDGRATQVSPDPGEETATNAGALESQARAPILNDAEMACEGRTWAMVTDKIALAKPLALASELPPDLLAAQQSVQAYDQLFERVFGDSEVTPERIVMAIATYERTLTADRTPWDVWRAGDASAMSEQQLHGFELFVDKGKCMCCHNVPLFQGTALFDDGFHDHSWDGGASEVDGMPGDYINPSFRVVTLRNVGLREPSGLLHDGVAPGTSLPALVAAYNHAPEHGVSACRQELGLSDAEQEDLIAFLREALTDPRVAAEQPPFDRPKLASE